MSSREEFEEWFTRELPVHNRDADSGEWHAGVLKAACELAWHSSRAALVVELPRMPKGPYERGDILDYTDDIREALTKAGVTVK